VAKAPSNTDTASDDTSKASLREQRRVQQQDLSRTQILDAAEQVFGERGYHDATLKDIAVRAEFSVGSVYSFFENKDDLFLLVFLRRGDEMLPMIREIAEGDLGPMAKLHALVDAEVGFFRQHRHFGRLFLRTSSATSPSPEREVDRAMHDRFREAMALQASVFVAGQKAKELRAGDPEALARLFSGLVSAYQATDPAVIGDDPDPVENLPLATLHAMVDAAFAAP